MVSFDCAFVKNTIDLQPPPLVGGFCVLFLAQGVFICCSIHSGT
jgi:hypothetical protein